MKKLIETIKNIYKIEELRERILITFLFVLVYRIGSFIALPGIDPHNLGALQQQAQEGILGILNMFTGGAFAKASIFALGIMPYISASIVIQLLGIAIPYFQKLQKEGESGRKKINQITRWLTVIICAGQGPSYIANAVYRLPPEAILVDTTFFYVSATIILITGTVFCMWLGEKITDRGIGNGISLLIMVGIIADLPAAFIGEFASASSGKGGGFVMLIVEMAIWLFIVLATIALVQATRRIPVNFAKRIVGNKQYGGVRQFIPLKVNAAGVMPIIFAQAIMFIPITLGGFSDSLSGFVGTFSDLQGFWYNFVFAVLIIAFTYFYTAITVNPTQISDDLKRNGGFIPGIKPGKRTEEYIDSVMTKVLLPGSIFLAIVAVFPAFAMNAGINTQFAQFYGGTSLLILVGVMLDTLQQIESYLLMRHYDGLMKTGRIKGRSSAAVSAV